MSEQKYVIIAHSMLQAPTEKDLQEYIAEREAEWGMDAPEEIKRLKETGVCTVSDEWGSTSIRILKVDDKGVPQQ